jgi:hypothetical protein
LWGQAKSFSSPLVCIATPNHNKPRSKPVFTCLMLVSLSWGRCLQATGCLCCCSKVSSPCRLPCCLWPAPCPLPLAEEQCPCPWSSCRTPCWLTQINWRFCC